MNAKRAIFLALATMVLTASTTASYAESPKAKFKVIYTFKGGSDGAQPIGGLARDAAGNLYGVTAYGGSSSAACSEGCGTIYRIDAKGHENVLYAFGGYPDGGYPFPVVLDAAGNIYGATLGGGDPHCGCGVAYKLDKSGNFTVLHTFEAGKDGDWPESALVMDGAGNLYGTTVAGGTGCTNQSPAGCGLIYKIDTKGNETILHRFTGSDGSDPSAALLRDSKGNLFGSALTGGTYGFGTIFELPSGRKLKVLHQFTGGSGSDNGYPYDGLTEDTSGNLYGTTEWHPAGSSRFGTVFKLAQDKKDTFTTLFEFDLTNGGYPVAGLYRDGKGDLFGTALSGGDCPYNQCGVVFEINRSGSESTVYNFQEGNDGYAPQAVLVSDKNGNLYGTALGGSTGDGVVFRVTP